MGRVGVRTCCRVGGEKQQHEENRTEQLVAAISAFAAICCFVFKGEISVGGPSVPAACGAGR